MTKLRCWPGAIAYITHPREFGRLLEVISLAPPHQFTLPNGALCLGSSNPEFPAWVVKAIGWKFRVRLESGAWAEREYAACDDRWLRPILPPPDAELTDDRAPCEVEA
jgi:hypothetical protein